MLEIVKNVEHNTCKANAKVKEKSMEHITVRGEKYSAWVACTNPYEIDRCELKEAVETLEKYNINNSVTQLVKNNTEKVERILKAILNKQQRALTDVNALIPTYVSDTITKTLVNDIRSMLSKIRHYMSDYAFTYLLKSHSDFFTNRRCNVNVYEPTLESVFGDDLKAQDSTILTDRDVELPSINNTNMVTFKSNGDVVIKVWYIFDMNRPRTSKYVGKEFTIKNGKKKWDKAQKEYQKKYEKAKQELYKNQQIENNKKFFEHQNKMAQSQEMLNAVETLMNALNPIIVCSLLQSCKPLQVNVLAHDMEQVEKLQDIQAQLYNVKFGGVPTTSNYITLVELAWINYHYISGLDVLRYSYKQEQDKQVA